MGTLRWPSGVNVGHRPCGRDARASGDVVAASPPTRYDFFSQSLAKDSVA